MCAKILILDDDTGILEVLTQAFEYENFEVESAATPFVFFNFVNNFKPDIFLIDFLLSGINGGEICQQLKQSPETCHLPVIMMSAYPHIGETVRKSGCDDFIEKPFDLFNLIDCVKAHLAR